MLELTLDVPGNSIARTEDLLRGIVGGAVKALYRAANKTVEGARTEVTRSILADYTIKSKDVRNTMRVKKASSSNMSAELRSTGPAVGVDHFDISPKTAGSPRPKIGVSIRVKRDGKGEPSKGTFLIPGTPAVFRRTGAERKPIERIFGPAVPSMVKETVDRDGLEVKLLGRFENELDHQVDFLLGGGK